MAAVAHTPGPWLAGRTLTVEGPHGRVVARCDAGRGQFKIEGDEALANARLISAAPDLFELARLLEKTVVFYMNADTEEETRRAKSMTLKMVRAVIGKATGETV